jgi:hypothetical protein
MAANNEKCAFELELKKMWMEIYEAAKTFRENGGEDGRSEWNVHKPKLREAFGKSCVAVMNMLPDDFKAKYKDDDLSNELHHFCFKIVKILSSDEITAVKLFQLAFNIGQAIGSGVPLIEEVGFDITDLENILQAPVKIRKEVE